MFDRWRRGDTFSIDPQRHLGYSKLILKKRAQGDLRRVFLFSFPQKSLTWGNRRRTVNSSVEVAPGDKALAGFFVDRLYRSLPQ
jgi:hypothetical protein